jgi:hypothetical protein
MQQLLGDPAILRRPATTMGLSIERTVQEFEECLRVEFATKTLRKGYQYGDMTPSDFVTDDIDESSTTTTTAPSSQQPTTDRRFETKIATLDPTTQTLIAKVTVAIGLSMVISQFIFGINKK